MNYFVKGRFKGKGNRWHFMTLAWNFTDDPSIAQQWMEKDVKSIVDRLKKDIPFCEFKKVKKDDVRRSALSAGKIFPGPLATRP